MTTSAPLDRLRARPRRRAPLRRTHELRWRLIRDEPKTGAENMALDHALSACLGSDEAVLRLYGWSRPTVSFGKNEPAERCDDAPRTDGSDSTAPDYVRRPTGGRAVLHDAELTYAVVCPLDAFGGLREAYVQINRALAGALSAMGAAVHVAGEVDALGSGVDAAAEPGGHAPTVDHPGAPSSPGPAVASGPLPLDAGPCFQSPTRGEIVAAGRKLVGSAQARLEGALLQHGSILLEEGSGQLGSECVTLTELLGEASYEAVADQTGDVLRQSFGGRWSDGGYDAVEVETAKRLVEERYGSDTWTWRR